MTSSIAAQFLTAEIIDGMKWILVGIGIIYHYVGKMENPYDDDDF